MPRSLSGPFRQHLSQYSLTTLPPIAIQALRKLGENLAIARTRRKESQRSVSLRYSDEWCERGFALSEDLPLLSGQEFMPRERDTAAGAVDDARPDRWGERVIRFIDKPARLSLLEYL